MKKLYTLVAAAGCILGASAAPVNLMQAQRTLETADLATSTMMKAPVKAAPEGDWNTVGEGTYSEGLLVDQIEAIDNFAAGSTWKVTIEQSASDPNWYRTIVYNENSPVAEQIGEPDTHYLAFNVADPDKVYIDLFEPFGLYNYAQYCPESFGSILANPQNVAPGRYGKLSDGVVTFNVTDAMLYYMIEGTQVRYGYVNGQFTLGIALPGHEFPNYWAEYGTAVFEDGLFGYLDSEEDADPLPIVVNGISVQKHIDVDNFFRFPDAWKHVTDGYQGMTPKPLIINAANAEDVEIPQQATGIMFNSGEMYLMSSNGHFQGLEYPITYKDNVIDMQAGSLAYTFPADLAEQSWYIPRPSTQYKYYGSKLTITPNEGGVEGVAVENANAPVEYYNLQGVRVANPSNGIFLVRQGSKVSKQVIR